MVEFSNYPNQIDTTTELPKATDNVTPVRAELFNRLRDALIAVEQELGIQPSSTYSTVKDRIDALEARINDFIDLPGPAEPDGNSNTITGTDPIFVTTSPSGITNITINQATNQSSGYMSTLDKIKLDNSTDLVVNDTLVKRNSSGIFSGNSIIADNYFQVGSNKKFQDATPSTVGNMSIDISGRPTWFESGVVCMAARRLIAEVSAISVFNAYDGLILRVNGDAGQSVNLPIDLNVTNPAYIIIINEGGLSNADVNAAAGESIIFVGNNTYSIVPGGSVIFIGSGAGIWLVFSGLMSP